MNIIGTTKKRRLFELENKTNEEFWKKNNLKM